MTGTFMFQGHRLEYLNHIYNTTWINERTVEVPIIWEIVMLNRGKRILEVGNVLPHYHAVNHAVLDKYERMPGVINQDVLEYTPSAPYDLIVSISTLEHIGWDENVYGGTGAQQDRRDPGKVLLVVDHLKNCLAAGGKMVITVPVGQNPVFDKYIAGGVIRFDQCYGMKRISVVNEWAEAPWTEVLGASYNAPFPFANAILIGIIRGQHPLKQESHT
jgi:hypothetical protein